MNNHRNNICAATLAPAMWQVSAIKRAPSGGEFIE